MTNDQYKAWQQGATTRKPTKDRGYDRWHVMNRQAQLLKQPFCQINITPPNCEPGHPAIATELDHIIPMRVKPELANEGSNHQSACKPCNAAKRHLDAKRWPIKYLR